MFWEIYLNLCKENNKTPNGVCAELGFSTATATHWKNGSLPKADALIVLSNYFNVTTDYLLGLETKAESLVRTTIKKSQIENDIKADEMTEMLSIASKLDEDALKFLSIMFGMSADERKSIMATAEKLAKK